MIPNGSTSGCDLRGAAQLHSGFRATLANPACDWDTFETRETSNETGEAFAGETPSAMADNHFPLWTSFDSY